MYHIRLGREYIQTMRLAHILSIVILSQYHTLDLSTSHDHSIYFRRIWLYSENHSCTDILARHLIKTDSAIVIKGHIHPKMSLHGRGLPCGNSYLIQEFHATTNRAIERLVIIDSINPLLHLSILLIRGQLYYIILQRFDSLTLYHYTTHANTLRPATRLTELGTPDEGIQFIMGMTA